MSGAPWCLAVVPIAIASVFSAARPALAQTADTFTASAALSGDAVNGPLMPITFVVARYTTETERAAMSAALEQGAAALHALFKTMPDVGHIVVNGRTIPIKYAYGGPDKGRTLGLVTDEPLAFFAPGSEPHKSKVGYDFAFVRLDFSLPGFAVGEVSPAVKLGVNSTGLISTSEYGAASIRLTDVQMK